MGVRLFEYDGVANNHKLEFVVKMKRRQSWCKKNEHFSIQKFSQNIPNFDTLERVWQSLFNVYNQTLRQMGDNDFSVEHTGVRVRQMAGTLERVVKYDAVAFQKAWDFLASSDDEDNYFFLFFLFFRRIIFPGKGAKYGLLGGDCFFQGCTLLGFGHITYSVMPQSWEKHYLLTLLASWRRR